MDEIKKNSRLEKGAELDARLTTRILVVDAVSANVGRLIRYSAIVFICRYMYYGVWVLSGRTTDAHFWIQVLANLKVSVALPWAFGSIGVVFGLRQRSLRRRAISAMKEHVRRLEEKIDADLPLGGLSPAGTAYTED